MLPRLWILFFVGLGCLLSVCLGSPAAAAPPQLPFEPEPTRLAEIQAMLASQPLSIGPAIENRAAWQRLGELFGVERSLDQARRLAAEPMPLTPRELYLDFSRTGNRSRYQQPWKRKRERLSRLVLAECITNTGEFLPAIEETIAAICNEPTWCIPAHDRSLDNLNQRVLTVDLYMVATGWDLAITNQWLGDRLSKKVKQRIRVELDRQIFEPYEQSVRTGIPKNFWLQITNNWNAVCLASVTGTALMTFDSSQRRAWYVAVAEDRIENFRAGFSKRGYCSEGITYWNYGVGHYLDLAEVMRLATGGEIDWYQSARTQAIVSSPWKLQMAPEVYPSFADAPVNSKASNVYTTLLNQRLNLPPLGKNTLPELAAGMGRSRLYEVGLILHPLAEAGIDIRPTKNVLPLRDEYPEAAVFVLRPAAGQNDGLSVAIKGGHNDEHHNHNDVGSFVVAFGGQTPLLDPGREVYTSRTFSPRRYESQLINSFGHPVPRIAGELQSTGRTSAAKLMNKTFTDQRDTIQLDLTAAYEVAELESLTRTFVFKRTGSGQLTVDDQVKFSEPQAFETALIAGKPWKELAQNRWQVGEGSAAVEVVVTSDAGKLEFTTIEIEEDTGLDWKPTRLGFRLTQPVSEARVTISIQPLARGK